MSAPMGAKRCMGRDGFGRIVYRSPAKAGKARKQLHGAADGPLRVYPCHRCAGWHLTSAPKR